MFPTVTSLCGRGCITVHGRTATIDQLHASDIGKNIALATRTKIVAVATRAPPLSPQCPNSVCSTATISKQLLQCLYCCYGFCYATKVSATHLWSLPPTYSFCRCLRRQLPLSSKTRFVAIIRTPNYVAAVFSTSNWGLWGGYCCHCSHKWEERTDAEEN